MQKTNKYAFILKFIFSAGLSIYFLSFVVGAPDLQSNKFEQAYLRG